MCTAITYHTTDHYFGRNLDLEYSYEEAITITPRNYPFSFRHCAPIKSHYAMIGMAYVQQGYPLYYDATNEAGLSVAGLNFPDNAFYHDVVQGKINIASFELMPWLLSQCRTVHEVKAQLHHMNITNDNFNDKLSSSPLHWLVADKSSTIVIECMQDGLHVYDNPIGVLTNNPPFPFQETYLSHFMGLSKQKAENRFAKDLHLQAYSRGMGAMGLPGDLSSASRFVRAAFVKMNSVAGESEQESVSQFFHILASVEQQRGCVELEPGVYEITVYASCCNVDKGIYYCRTYDDFQMIAIDMYQENLDGTGLVSYRI